ncbi:MAG: hypothetical protein RLZZ383_2584 [Pseudomonadota bacterium]|jgi:hypothetical protein
MRISRAQPSMFALLATFALLAMFAFACAPSTAAPTDPPEAARPIAATAAPPTTPAPTAPGRTDATYDDWLRSVGVDPALAHEATLAGPPGWRFFYASRTPGDKTFPAAVYAGGLVHAQASDGWDDLLRAGSVEQVASAVTWLLGNGTWLAPGSPLWSKVPAKGEGHVAAPQRTFTDGHVTVELWLAEPPSFAPYRVRIVARGVDVERTSLPLHRVLDEPSVPQPHEPRP